MKNAFVLLVAFLLDNNLMKECRLVFLTDGAKCISDNIEYFHKLPFYNIYFSLNIHSHVGRT